MSRLLAIFLVTCAAPVWAGEDQFSCSGADPDWSLSLSSDAAEFTFADRSSQLDIPQRSVAEGAEWPQAMTIVGPRDSAIVLLDRKACGDADIAAHVMTQRGQTPILLTGCCTLGD